jgi:hypothetical protein
VDVDEVALVGLTAVPARFGGEQSTGLGELLRLSRPKVERAPGSG